MNEIVNLSVQELTYLTTNEQEFKASILESNGEILSILDSYGITYSLDSLLDSTIFIYGYPYLITRELNTKQNRLLKKNEKLLGKSFLSNNIKNLKELENTMNFISGVSSLSKRDDSIIKELMQNTKIDIISIIINAKNDNKKFDENFVYLSKDILEWILKDWDNINSKDKEIIKNLSPKFWTAGMIYNNQKPSNDKDRDLIVSSVANLKLIFNMMTVKILDYLYDLELHKIKKTYIITDVLNSATDSYGNKLPEKSHYGYLAKSKFFQHLDDVRFLISMRYDFFKGFNKNTGIAKRINKETLLKKDAFSIFIENMSLSRGIYPLIKMWSELNSHEVEFDRILNPQLFSSLKEAYGKKDKTLDVIDSFSDVLANKKSMNFYIRFLDFICDETIKNLDKSNLQDIKFSVDILSEYVKMMTNTKMMFHSKKDLELVSSSLEKVVDVFKNIFNKDNVDLNSILFWNHNKEMRVFLCGFLNKYPFKGILGDFENILMANKKHIEQSDYSIGDSFESLDENKKFIVDVLLNRFKEKNNKEAKYETLHRLHKITKINGYEDEIISLLNKELGKDINFIQLLTNNKVILPSDILEKLVELYTSRATDVQLLIKNYLNMVNENDSKEISIKIMVSIMGFIKDEEKDIFFNMGKYREKENLVIDEILSNKKIISNIYLNEGLYLNVQNKLLENKDYLTLLKFRNLYIENQILGFNEPLKNLKDDDLEKILMNDDRFIIYLDSLKDSLNSKKDIVSFDFKNDRLFSWISDFFKRNPAKQMVTPIELLLFDIPAQDCKSYLLKNNAEALFSKNLTKRFNLVDFKLKEFVLITKKNLESGLALNKDKLDFIKDYLDKVFNLEDFNKLLNNYKTPESYAILVSLANQTIMSKTSFYSDGINLDKFLDGIEIILNKIDKCDRFDYERMFENSFKKTISLSSKNKEKILLGFSELGLEVNKNTFPLAEEYLKTMNGTDIDFMLKNLINIDGKSNSLLIEVYLNKENYDDELLFKLKNYQLQSLAKNFIENKVDAKQGNYNILALELKSAYKGLSMFNFEMKSYADTVTKLDILIQSLVMSKNIDLKQKKTAGIKF